MLELYNVLANSVLIPKCYRLKLISKHLVSFLECQTTDPERLGVTSHHKLRVEVFRVAVRTKVALAITRGSLSLMSDGPCAAETAIVVRNGAKKIATPSSHLKGHCKQNFYKFCVGGFSLRLKQKTTLSFSDCDKTSQCQ